LQQVQPSSAQGFSFARKQETTSKTIGAKKLDLDFGNSDDFFNSFQPTEPIPQSTNKL